jgi:hypothetical protein
MGNNTDDLQARLGGRAGAYNGEAVVEPTPVNHTVYNQDIPTSGGQGTTGTNGQEWYVVGVVKKRATDPDAVTSPRPASYSVTANATAMVRVVRESDISGTIEYDEPSNTNRSDTEVAIDAAEDTPDRLSIDTITDPADGEAKMPGVKVGNGLLEGGASKGPNSGSPVLNEQSEDFGVIIPRDFVYVYMLAARSGNALDADIAFDFVNAG